MNRIVFVILLGVLGLVPERSLGQEPQRDSLDRALERAFGSGGNSNSRSGKPKSKQEKQVTRQEVYAVVQIGEEIKVVPSSQLASEKKRAVEHYRRDLKDYQDSMKEAGKNKVDISKPVQKQVKVLKASFKNKEAADEYVQKRFQDNDQRKVKKKLVW